MLALRTQITLGLVVVTLLGAAPLAAASERFEKVWCLRYAVAPDAPLSMLLAGAPRDVTLDLPFAMCVARSPRQVMVLDSAMSIRSSANPSAPATGGNTRRCSPRWALHSTRCVS